MLERILQIELRQLHAAVRDIHGQELVVIARLIKYGSPLVSANLGVTPTDQRFARHMVENLLRSVPRRIPPEQSLIASDLKDPVSGYRPTFTMVETIAGDQQGKRILVEDRWQPIALPCIDERHAAAVAPRQQVIQRQLCFADHLTTVGALVEQPEITAAIDRGQIQGIAILPGEAPLKLRISGGLLTCDDDAIGSLGLRMERSQERRYSAPGCTSGARQPKCSVKPLCVAKSAFSICVPCAVNRGDRVVVRRGQECQSGGRGEYAGNAPHANPHVDQDRSS